MANKIKIGLKDDFGTDIHAGDELVWTYKAGGHRTHDGRFFECVPPAEFVEKEMVQVIQYEIRKDAAGYFLDRPSGLGVMYTRDTIKCKVKTSTNENK